MFRFWNRKKDMFEWKKHLANTKIVSRVNFLFEGLQNFNQHFLYVIRVFKEIIYCRVEKIKYKVII